MMHDMMPGMMDGMAILAAVMVVVLLLAAAARIK